MFEFIKRGFDRFSVLAIKAYMSWGGIEPPTFRSSVERSHH